MEQTEPATRLDDKVALVTGASSGIGRAVALELRRAGCRVALSARRYDRLEAFTAELGGEGQAVAIPVNLREEPEIDNLFDAVRKRWGGVDILINSGGLGLHAPLTEPNFSAWREMLEVNVLALSKCTQLAVTDMRTRGDRGHVVHISSMSAHRVPGGSGMYAATKFAVRALTEGLRKELRELDSAIRVTSISPGYVETEFAEVYHGNREAGEKTYGRFKVLQVEDIASTVMHVLRTPQHVEVHDVLMRATRQAT